MLRFHTTYSTFSRLGAVSLLLVGLSLVLGSTPVLSQEKAAKEAGMMPQVTVNPVGRVEKRDGKIFLHLQPEFAAALDGIDDYSHLWVIFWFHGNDTPEKRRTLKVHPRGNPANPLTGVFATRSPVRPNLLGLQVCRLLQRQGNRLEVEKLDAWDGSPIVDLKPYLPQLDSIPQTAIPQWAQGQPPE